MAEVLILKKGEIKELFNLKMAIEAVESAYKEKATGSGCLWPMIFHEFVPGQADMDIKSGDLANESIYGLKLVSWFADNQTVGKPALYGTMLIFDRHTGEPISLLNASALTDLRTGAAGAVGVKYLAKKDAKIAMLAGCGELAPYLVAATLLVRPKLEKFILVNPRHGEKAALRLPVISQKVDELLKACGEVRLTVIEAEPCLENAVRKSDIILTATPSRQPFIKKEWVKSGVHFSCVGADMAGKQELDEEILRNAVVIGDDAKQCLAVGECEIAYKKGIISKLSAEIGEIIAGQKITRTDNAQLTVFDSTGIALQDLTSAAAVIKKARLLGKGVSVEL